jgi:cytochrome c peroxidase
MVSWPPYPGRKASLLALAVLAGALTAAAPTVRSLSGAEPITPIPAPAGLDPRRVALGEQLFRDPRLSHDNTLSCGSCHDTSTNGASANARDRGANGSLLPFNTPTVFNAALNFRLTWEGNVRSLEREAEEGLRNPAIMASSAEEALVKISADKVMTERFRVAYGRAPDVPACALRAIRHRRAQNRCSSTSIVSRRKPRLAVWRVKQRTPSSPTPVC